MRISVKSSAGDFMLSANNDNTLNNNALADSMAVSQAFAPENFGKTKTDNWFESIFANKHATHKINETYNKQQLAYDTYMSNTAYSRAIADLKSQGINPYLAISGLSQASAPSSQAGTRAQSPGAESGFQFLLGLGKIFLSAFGFAKGLASSSMSHFGFGR